MDRSGNMSEPMTFSYIPPDQVPPTVVLSGAPETFNSTDSFTVYATVSEKIFGFTASDIQVTNAEIREEPVIYTDAKSEDIVYSFVVSPTQMNDITVFIPAGKFTDLAANANLESNRLIIRNSIVEETQKAIAEVMLNRAHLLANNQPIVLNMLETEQRPRFYFDATQASGTLAGFAQHQNVWMDLSGTWSDSSSYFLSTVGAHGRVTDNVIFGGMLQFDYLDQDSNDATGYGWMAGPYLAAKHETYPLNFEARVLYGQSDNEITPLPNVMDKFETSRWLGQTRVSGEYDLYGVTLKPLVDFSYSYERQRSYVNQFGHTVSNQSVGVAQTQAGLDFAVPLLENTGTLELTGGLSGIYAATFGDGSDLIDADFEDFRGKAKLGLQYRMDNGLGVGVNGFYDGIGADYEGYGGNLNVHIPF